MANCSAGLASVFAETCPGDCYVDWVAGSPSNFDNAYFEVKSVKIFGSGPVGIDTVIQASAATPRMSSSGWAGFASMTVTVVLVMISSSFIW